jgi:hypothetical protein
MHFLCSAISIHGLVAIDTTKGAAMPGQHRQELFSPNNVSKNLLSPRVTMFASATP